MTLNRAGVFQVLESKRKQKVNKIISPKTLINFQPRKHKKFSPLKHLLRPLEKIFSEIYYQSPCFEEMKEEKEYSYEEDYFFNFLQNGLIKKDFDSKINLWRLKVELFNSTNKFSNFGAFFFCYLTPMLLCFIIITFQLHFPYEN